MQKKKKTTKGTKNKSKQVEKELDIIENNLDNLQKVAQKERKAKIEEKIISMREDLKMQLLNQNKFGEQFDDMIENYLFLVALKEDLQHDINVNGFRYETQTGNGYTTSKPNESVPNLLKVSTEMRKILQDLELKEPDEKPPVSTDFKVGDNEDDLL